jgi:heme exporter protein D
MTEVATHTGFILAAYLATAVVLAAVTVWILVDGRSLRRRLAELEARGIRRRSAKGAE